MSGGRSCFHPWSDAWRPSGKRPRTLQNPRIRCASEFSWHGQEVAVHQLTQAKRNNNPLVAFLACYFNDLCPGLSASSMGPPVARVAMRCTLLPTVSPALT